MGSRQRGERSWRRWKRHTDVPALSHDDTEKERDKEGAAERPAVGDIRR